MVDTNNTQLMTVKAWGLSNPLIQIIGKYRKYRKYRVVGIPALCCQNMVNKFEGKIPNKSKVTAFKSS